MPASRPSSAGKRLQATLDAADRAAEEILAEARLEAHEVVRAAERRAIERTEELNRQSDLLMARARELTREAEELGNATRELTAQAREALSVEADGVIEVEVLEEGVLGGTALAESTLASVPAPAEEPTTRAGSATEEQADDLFANGARPSDAESPAGAEARVPETAAQPQHEAGAGETGEEGEARPSAIDEPSVDPEELATGEDAEPPRRKRRFGLFRRRRREEEPESPVPQPSQAELDDVTDEQMTVARSMFAAGLAEDEVEAQLAEILDLGRARAIIARLRPARDTPPTDRKES